MVGRLLMAGSILQLIVFAVGVSRRSYLVLALPVGSAVAMLSGLAFWVGYTMAYAELDDEEPYPSPRAAAPEPPEAAD